MSYVEQIHTISVLLPLMESCAQYCFQHNFVVNLGQRFSCHHVNVLFFFFLNLFDRLSSVEVF